LYNIFKVVLKSHGGMKHHSVAPPGASLCNPFHYWCVASCLTEEVAGVDKVLSESQKQYTADWERT
jgi:hypothetical protein